MINVILISLREFPSKIVFFFGRVLGNGRLRTGILARLLWLILKTEHKITKRYFDNWQKREAVKLKEFTQRAVNLKIGESVKTPEGDTIKRVSETKWKAS